MGSPEHLGALLDSVSEKLPKLISGLVNTVYSAEAGTNIGQAVGNLYKELTAAGIPQDEAIAMAKDYMLSITKIMSNLKMDGSKQDGNKQ